MNLRQLEAFRAAYLTGSVSRAAETLYVSQPSVSRLVSDLETSVGFSLFIRTARGLEPTAEARQLYSAVERAYVGLADIREAADSIRTRESGQVSLGAIPAFAYSVVPEAVAMMHQESSHIRLNVNLRTTEAIVDEIETNRRDLGIVSPTREYPNVTTYFSRSTCYVCLLPEDHSLAEQGAPIDLLTLGDEGFVVFDASYLEFIVADRETRNFINARSRLSTHSAPVLALLARATGSVAIVDPYTATFAEALGGMVSRPIMQEIRHSVAVIGPSDHGLSLAARDLVSVLQTVIDRHVATQTTSAQ